MDLMEFFKNLFGDKALTYEEFKNSIDSAEGVKLANLKTGAYVGKDKFDSLLAEKEGYKNQLENRDKQLEELKKLDPKSLQDKITELENANKTAKEDFNKQLKNVKVNSLVELALTNAGAKNMTAAKAILGINADEVEFDDNGKIKGLDERLNAIKESDSYMFKGAEAESKEGGFTGVDPKEGTTEPLPAEPKSYMDFFKIAQNKND